MLTIRLGAALAAAIVPLAACSSLGVGGSPGARVTASGAPDGYVLVRGDTTHVEFVVPETWHAVSDEQLQPASSTDEVDVAYEGVEGAAAYLSLMPQVDEVPTTNELEYYIRWEGDRLRSSEYLDTPIGRGVLVQFFHPTEDHGHLYGATLFFMGEGGVTNLTLIAGDGPRTRDLLDVMIPSLRTVD